MRKFLILFLLLISIRSFSQNGAWLPQGAHTSFPRTMLKNSDLEAVQSSLSEASIQILYQGVCASALSNVPAGNSSSGDRRARAGISKNAGFVLLMNKKVLNGTIADLPEDEKVILESKVISLLESINTDVEAVTSYTEWQWRSKELIDYVIAYDMLKGAGTPDHLLVVSKNRLQEFTGKLYEEATKGFLGLNFFSSVKNNHALMTAAALGIAAVVLNDAGSSTESQQPQKWIDAAMWNMDNILWRDEKRQSEPGTIGGYAEGPYYFKYAFINCLPFIRAIGNFVGNQDLTYTYKSSSRSIPNPYFDPNYDNLYEWMRIIRMPDGRMPALDDSYIDMAMPELAITGKSKYNWPLHFEKLQTNQRNTLDKQLNVVVDLRANYIAANIPPENFSDKIFQALPVSGNVVFRSSWERDAIYMHLHAENGRALSGTGGHNQADEASFIIQAHGQLLALDPGYLSYGRRNELGNAHNHNMILVNGKGPDMGAVGSTNGAEVFINDNLQHDLFSSSHLTTTYAGADISRRVLFIRNKYFIISDQLTSSTINDYQWQLHGYGLENGNQTTGIFTDNVNEQKGFYTKNGVTLLAQVAVENGISSFEKRTDQHELDYNKTEDHTTLLINKNGTENTSFLSLLAPYIEADLNSQIVPSTAASIKIKDNEYNDFVMSRTNTELISFSDSETGLQSPIETDAQFAFFSEHQNGDIAEYYFTKGSTFTSGTKELVKTDKKVNFYIETQGDEALLAEISEATNIYLRIEQFVSSVDGDHVQGWHYNRNSKLLSMTISNPTVVRIHLDLNPPPVDEVTMVSKEIEKKQFHLFPNPAAGFVTFSFNDQSVNSGVLEILNGNGQVFIRKNVSQKMVLVDISKVPKGMYFCRYISKYGLPKVEKLLIN